MTVRLSELSNGLRVITDDMPGIETAAVGIWIDAGTRHEPPLKNGVAHFLEHMAFKGTARRSALQISEQIENVGGYVNAYTSRDGTLYHAGVLRPDVGLAVDILADILQNSAFDIAALEIERAIILQEMADNEDSARSLISDQFISAAFKDQPIGRPGLGTAESVGCISRGDVIEFLLGRYCPSKMILSAAGVVDHERILAAAEHLLGSTPRINPNEQAAVYVGSESYRSGNTDQVHVMVGFCGPAHSDEDAEAGYVLSTVLGGGASSRLYQSIRERDGIAYDIGAFQWSFADVGVFGIGASTDAESVEDLLSGISGEIETILVNGILPAELLRAKAQSKASLMRGIEGSEGRRSIITSWLSTYGNEFSLAEAVDRVERVDGAAIVRAMERWRSARPTIAALGPVINTASFEAFAAGLW